MDFWRKILLEKRKDCQKTSALNFSDINVSTAKGV
jgi:hypothetical protein